MKLLQFIEHV